MLPPGPRSWARVVQSWASSGDSPGAFLREGRHAPERGQGRADGSSRTAAVSAYRRAAKVQAQRAERGKAELKAEFVQLKAKGLSYAKVARRLGVAKSTLANW